MIPTISFTTSNYVVREEDGAVEVCLELNVPLVADFDVSISSASGTGKTRHCQQTPFIHSTLNCFF